MQICKIHALGNDFLVLRVESAAREDVDYAPIATALCDRHYGLGADGLMLLRGEDGTQEAPCGARIFNADGSEAEMSGNGLRCAATFLRHFHEWKTDPLHFQTTAGLRTARFLERREFVYFFESMMGRPRFSNADIPMILAEPREPVVRYPLAVGDGIVETTVLSMGNPHCVVFRDHWSEMDRAYLGMNIAGHPIFPNGTNVEFVEVLNRSEIRVHFWERGVGKTFSSGTGSCAAAVASALQGMTDDRITVRTSSGKVTVDWRDRREVYLTGPAEILFRGEFYLPAAAACELY